MQCASVFPRIAPLRQRLLHGGLWAIVGHVAQAALPMAQYALLARLLSPEDFGVYFLAFSIAHLMVAIACQGIPAALIRLIATSLASGTDHRVRAFVSQGRRFALVSSIFLALLTCGPPGRFVATTALDSTSLASVLPWIALWSALLAQHRISVETFRGFGDLRSVALLGQLLPSATLVAVFATATLQQHRLTIRDALAITAYVTAATTLIAGVLLHTLTLSRTPRGHVSLASLLRISVPLGLEGIIALAATQAHLWILAAASTEAQIALFSSANRLTVLVTFPLIIATAAVPPIISELYAERKIARLEEVLRTVANLSALPALLALLPLLLAGGLIMRLLYGDFYAAGHLTVAILVLGQMVSALSGIPGHTLQMTTGERFRLAITTSTSAVGVAITWIGSRHGMGSVAAAAGVATALALQNLASVFAARKVVGVWTHISPKAVPRNIAQLITMARQSLS